MSESPHVDPRAALHETVLGAMRTALGERALPANADPLIQPARDPRFGDFQSNAAMPLAKRIGDNPRELASRIAEALAASGAFRAIAEAPEVAGPGFINITLKGEALAAALTAIDTPALGVGSPERTLNVVIDLCGVNLAKQMHVGHLRATVIGDTLARVHERLHHRVTRQNHFGDWGLPIAMVTRAVRTERDAGRLDLATLTLEHLEQMYRSAQRACAVDRKGLAAVERFDLGPKAKAEIEAQVEGALAELEEAKKALVALQAGDEEMVAVWREICRVTLDACFAECAMLGSDVTDEYTAGESSYATELGEVVADLESRGVAEPSEGALVVRLEDVDIKEPLLVRKSDGGFLYATTDLAAIRRRVHRLHADRVVYAVDARQSLHFRQVFAASKKAGYASRPIGAQAGTDAELIHAAFGTVLGEDGRPFKSRSGDNVKLADLTAEAVSRADAAVAEKNPELPGAERTEIARAIGIGALRYADLSGDRIKDYVFDFDRMLAFEGNTGPYLQYAGVRIASILRKAEERFGAALALDDGDGAALGDFAVREPEEKAIALALLGYPAALRSAAEACEPHRVCAYLYDLATAFSSFFAACPVLGADDESTRNARLRLCRLTGAVLRDGLRTLGITPLERM
ncbi:MAG: arginine--tRNA ligase [Planctomycetota bacterium]